MQDRRILVVFVLVLVIWAAMPAALALLGPQLPPGWLQALPFEASGALFSGLAFAGLLWTIWDQQRQIAESRSAQHKLARIQEDQATQLKKAAEIQEDQVAQLKKAAEIQERNLTMVQESLRLSRQEALERQFHLHYRMWESCRDAMTLEGVEAEGPELAAHALAAIRAWGELDDAAQPDCAARLLRFENGRISATNTVYGPMVSLTGDLLAIIDDCAEFPATRKRLARWLRSSLSQDERLLLLAFVFYRPGDKRRGPPDRAARSTELSPNPLAEPMIRNLLLDGVAEQARNDRVLRWAWMRYSPSRDEREAMR